MEHIKSGREGTVSPLGQTFPTNCFVLVDSSIKVPDQSTAYGYVIAGTATVDNRSYEEGEYFLAPALSQIGVVDGNVVVFVRVGYRGQKIFGGVVDSNGRSPEGDNGVQSTDLIPRHTQGDPGFVSKHLPRIFRSAAIRKNMPLFCVVVEGAANIFTSEDSYILNAGDVFILQMNESYRLQVGEKPFVYLVFEAVVDTDV